MVRTGVNGDARLSWKEPGGKKKTEKMEIGFSGRGG